jgi:hypothetical protein
MESASRMKRKNIVEMTTSFKMRFLGVTEVHEEEHHEKGFGGGDDEGNGGVEASEIELGGIVSKRGADEQRGPDGEVGGERRFRMVG